jgi:hypothetical protein
MLCNDLIAHRAFVIFSSDPARDASVDDFWSGRLPLDVAEKYLAMGRKSHYYWLERPGMVAEPTVWALRDMEKSFFYSGYCVGCQHTEFMGKVNPLFSFAATPVHEP